MTAETLNQGLKFDLLKIQDPKLRTTINDMIEKGRCFTDEQWGKVEAKFTGRGEEAPSLDEFLDIMYQSALVLESRNITDENGKEALLNIHMSFVRILEGGDCIGINFAFKALKEYLEQHGSPDMAVVAGMQEGFECAVTTVVPSDVKVEARADTINEKSLREFAAIIKVLDDLSSIAQEVSEAHKPLSPEQIESFWKARDAVGGYLLEVTQEQHNALYPQIPYEQLKNFYDSFQILDKAMRPDYTQVIALLQTPVSRRIEASLRKEAESSILVQGVDKIYDSLNSTIGQIQTLLENQQSAYEMLPVAARAIDRAVFLYLVLKYGAPQEMSGINTREAEVRKAIDLYNATLSTLKSRDVVWAEIPKIDAEAEFNKKYLGVFSVDVTHGLLRGPDAIVQIQNEMEAVENRRARIRTASASLPASLTSPFGN